MLLLRATDQNVKTSSNLYLLIGFIRGSTNGVYKPAKDKEKFVSGYEYFCDRYTKGKTEISINFDAYDGKITGKEYPITA